MTPEQLATTIRGLADTDTFELTKVNYFGPVGERDVWMMPGVSGTVVEHAENGAVVRMPVRAARHVLRMVGIAA